LVNRIVELLLGEATGDEAVNLCSALAALAPQVKGDQAVVVVGGRAFVRSWSVKPDGWYQTFLDDPRGAIRLKDRDIDVCAVPVRDKRTLDAIDRAYLEKYNTPGAIKYARDLGSAKSRAATLELKPCT
jgi:hypothetical protein